MENMFIAPENIPVQYRPVPFWSWNDRLEPEELLRQIREMHDAGMGGFFMHARGGLLTPYMQKEWMQSICICVREAVRLGMHAYLYDENGWPSGFGNGMVNALGVDYQQKYLRYAPFDKLNEEEKKRVIRRYDNGFAAFYDVNPYYVDNMDCKVVDAFLEKVYQFYWDHLPEDVRRDLTGIFTDEPQLSRDGIPWSFVLEDEYRKSYGESLEEKLPDLFTESEGCFRTRIRFWELCTRLFCENYINRIGAWCKERNWEFTGHHVLEENYLVQLTTNGAIMPQFSGYSIPGVDHLARRSSYVVADIQTVSVAAQLGKKRILTETFGCSGWNFNFHGMNWLYEQQMVHGVNLLCQHLAGYSLRGMRKRDYPASIFYQHPMWKDIRFLHDRFSRVGMMLASGRIECDTLVLHGQSTAWLHFSDRGDNELIGRYFDDFDVLSQALDASGIPFHYGDEYLLAHYGKVEADRFCAGEMTYRAVVIPPVENLSRPVLELLRRFAANGGCVLRMKNTHASRLLIDGVAAASEEQKFFFALPEYAGADEIINELRNRVAYLDICVRSGVPGQVRGTWRLDTDSGKRWYFLADFDTVPEKRVHGDLSRFSWCETVGEEKDVPVEITLPFAAKKLRVIDSASGRELEVLHHINIPGRGAKFCYTFPAAGSLLIAADPAETDCAGADLSDNWHFSGDCRNILTIDRADYRVNGSGVFEKAVDTISIFNRLLQLPENVSLELRYHFFIREDLDLNRAALQMAVEPDPFAVYMLNGKPAGKILPDDHFIDRSIRVLELDPAALKYGANCFEVKTQFVQRPEIRETLERAKCFEGESNKLFFDSEVEAVYLLGKFGCFNCGKVQLQAPCCKLLSGPFEIGSVPASFCAGDLTGSGYPFFSGTISLEKNFILSAEQARKLSNLTFTPFRANSIEAELNGVRLATVWSAPYRLDVSGLLREGENHLRLYITTSCRNTLGPLHTQTVEPMAVGPFSFLMERSAINFDPPPVTQDYGIIEPGPQQILLT